MKEEKTTWFSFDVTDKDVYEAMREEAGFVSLPQWMLFEVLRERKEYRTLHWLMMGLFFLVTLALAFSLWIW